MRTLISLAAAALYVALSPIAAWADGDVSPVEDGLVAEVTEEYITDDVTDSPSPELVANPVIDVGTVIVTAFCDGVNWSAGCVPETADEPPAMTQDVVLRAFRRLSLPEAKLVIQPPKGRTLVNFETNFYTEQGELTRTVTLLGQRVELRIWPASFGWRFGDGESDRTTTPGAAYPDLEITHRYLEKGRVSPSVDTTYAAEFRVGGGPWQDVARTVTIPGSPQQLRVVEARPVLVGRS